MFLSRPSRSVLLISVPLIIGQARAQLTYALENTVLLIDEVVDSSRVDIPWEIIWGPDDRLWMTDGPRIIRWDPVTDVIDTLLDRGYGNGLGMVLHPDFPATPIVMAVFDTSSYYAGGQLCEVSRLTYDPVGDVLGDEQVLFTYPHSGEHAAGRLMFDTTGHVLLTTADYWAPDDTLFYPRGKVLRFTTEGGVPADNPRADRTWTCGHRNPQGLAMLPNGNVVTVEHGQATNEVNLIQRDHNYGWFAFDAAMCTNVWPDSCTSPTFQNTLPIATGFFQAPSGTEYYTGQAIPELTDKLISCILWAKGLKTFTFTAAYDSVITQGYLDGGAFDSMWRIRDIAIRPDGGFYLITNDRMDARIRYVHPDLGTASHASDRTDEPAPWPNPVHDQLSVPLPVGANWTLCDAQGRIVAAPGYRVGDRLVLRLGELPSGLYLFSASQGGEQWVHRLVRE
jgi:glucose/arabinose dehydrogenase